MSFLIKGETWLDLLVQTLINKVRVVKKIETVLLTRCVIIYKCFATCNSHYTILSR